MREPGVEPGRLAALDPSNPAHLQIDHSRKVRVSIILATGLYAAHPQSAQYLCERPRRLQALLLRLAKLGDSAAG